MMVERLVFFFQAEDGIRDLYVTGVQTCALPILVITSTTLADAFAAEVSMLVIVACANGLRTIARCRIPGSEMLSVHRVRPVISRWSSLRRRSRPISGVGVAGASWTVVMRSPPRWWLRP